MKPCEVCKRIAQVEACEGCGRQVCSDCQDRHYYGGCGCTVCGKELADTPLDEEPSECGECGTGPWCEAHLAHPHMSIEERAARLLAHYDKGVVEADAMREEADAEWDRGNLSAYDDVQEFESGLDEMLPDFVEIVRSLLKGETA